jgi:Ni,Fe-hydrogenase III large subunit
MTEPLHNGEAISLDRVRRLEPQELVAAADAAIGDGERLAALFALTEPDENAELFALLADDREGTLRWLRAALSEKRYPALSATRACAQAFEREIFEQTGIVPDGHPWLKPLRRHAELERDPQAANRFFAVAGPGVHEVAVGPVHAGIIEPGHFRFQCHGEEVLSLEIQLGYQHRGVEALLAHASPARGVVLAESIAGDTAVGHAIAYATVMEALDGSSVPLRGEALRAVALELERLANHVGDLGGLCTDIGYLPGAAYFGRIRGEFLNSLMEISGNRFGRGFVRPGGVRFDFDDGGAARCRDRLQRVAREVRETAELSLRRPSVESRFERTGVVSRAVADDLGLVGPVARASGSTRDVRRDHAHGFYRYAHIPVTTLETGDVMARAMVRWLEAERSLEFLDQELAALPAGAIHAPPGAARPNAIAAALVEGWRGEIVHVAVTDARGEIRRHKVVDPSFRNWFGLAIALRGNQISDFPLCNKSFNLSYAGHDL